MGSQTSFPVAVGAPASLSPLDEARYGIRTARAAAFTALMLPAIIDFCGAEGVRLLIARSADTDPETMRAARSAGLRLMDALMYWVADLSRLPRERPRPQLHVRPAGAAEAPVVRDVAIRAFRGYTGHYHSDPRLDAALCDEAYGDWAARSCADESPDRVMVAEIDGRVAGFTTARLDAGAEGHAVLSGVDPAFRRRGLYTGLHLGRMEWLREQGAVRMWSPTLATNAVTQRTYVKTGLVHGYACCTFHRWFDDDRRTP